MALSPSLPRIPHAGLAVGGVAISVLGLLMAVLGPGGPVLSATGGLLFAEGSAMTLAATLTPPVQPRTERIVDGVLITRRAPDRVARRAAVGWSVLAGAPGLWLVAVPWLTHGTHRQVLGLLGLVCGAPLLLVATLPWRRESGDGSVELRVTGVRQAIGRRTVAIAWPTVASTPGCLPIRAKAVGMPDEPLTGLVRQLATDPSTQADLADEFAARRVAAVLGIESSA